MKLIFFVSKQTFFNAFLFPNTSSTTLKSQRQQTRAPRKNNHPNFHPIKITSKIDVELKIHSYNERQNEVDKRFPKVVSVKPESLAALNVQNFAQIFFKSLKIKPIKRSAVYNSGGRCTVSLWYGVLNKILVFLQLDTRFLSAHPR